MALQAAGRRLTRILTATCAAGLCVAGIGAAPASAAPSALNMRYGCTFPVVGTHEVTVSYEADLPDSTTQGVPTSSATITATISVPAQVTEGLILIGATSVSGTASGELAAVNGTSSQNEPISYTVPRTPVASAGGFTIDGTGTIPALTFPNVGSATVRPGNITLTLTPLTGTGQPTVLGTLETYCDPMPGQDTVLATIRVNAPAGFR